MPVPTNLTITGFSADAIPASAYTVDACARSVVGKVVQRATAALPQSTTAAIFTVAGGRCLVLSILGEVTTVIQTQANNTKLQANPTATGSSVDMCANLDVTASVVGDLWAITGTLSDAMTKGLAAKAQLAGIIVQTGTIDLVCAASNTGSVKWTLHYVPLDDGATIVAA